MTTRNPTRTSRALRVVQQCRDAAGDRASGPSRFHRRAIVGARRPRARPNAPMPNSSTILLVDDEESIQTLLTYPLEQDGYTVVQARDGEKALRRFEDSFDLVVLDVMLPRLDGLEVCKRLRSQSNVPIIMLTARGEELDKVLGLGSAPTITSPSRSRSGSFEAGCVRFSVASTPQLAGEREEVIERGRAAHRRSSADGRRARRARTAHVHRVRDARRARTGRRRVLPTRAARAPRGRAVPRAADDRRPRTPPTRRIERDPATRS